MKCLVFLSLLAVTFAVTNHGLGEIANSATAQVVVTSQFPDAKVAPVLTTLSATPTTYDASASLVLLTFSGTVTSTGNNTATGIAFTISNGGQDARTFSTSVNFLTGAFSSGSTYDFRTTGTYTVSNVVISTILQVQFSVAVPATNPSIAVTAYAGASLSAVSVATPQTGGCDNTGCTNAPDANATITVGKANQGVTLLFRSPAAASAAYVVGSAATTGTTGKATFTGSLTTLSLYVGGVSGNDFVPVAIIPSATSLLPKNLACPVSAFVNEDTGAVTKATYQSEAVVGALQSAVTFTVGTSDVTAPTCTSVSITPATITTYGRGNPSQTFQAAVTCADENGGSGLNSAVVIANVVSGSSTQTVTLSTSAATPVPNYVSGTVSVIGVYAVDNAGNVALYGSCGSASSSFPGVCGGSSSSSTVAASLLLIAALALALLA